MPNLKHHHKYERTEVGKKGWIVYRCTLPECNHYLPHAELIINKLSLCWGNCGGEVVYTQADFNQKLKRPMCASCRKMRKDQIQSLQLVPEVEELTTSEDY